MTLFAWRERKQREMEAGQAAIEESSQALREVKAATQRAKTISQRLTESRQENHYAERLRKLAYGAVKR